MCSHVHDQGWGGTPCPPGFGIGTQGGHGVPLHHKVSPFAWPLIALINFYRRFVSPYTPPACRFTPTCSRYAIDALRRYGALKGGWLATWRILRCNPFCRGGYDPLL